MHHRDTRRTDRMRVDARRGGHRVSLQTQLGAGLANFVRRHVAHDERSAVELVAGRFKRLLGGVKRSIRETVAQRGQCVIRVVIDQEYAA